MKLLRKRPPTTAVAPQSYCVAFVPRPELGRVKNPLSSVGMVQCENLLVPDLRRSVGYPIQNRYSPCLYR
jgi:hypothetical protein